MYGKINNLCVVKCVEKFPPLHWLQVFFIIVAINKNNSSIEH